MNSIKFVTIREADKLSKDKMRKGAHEWLNSGSEDNFTKDKNYECLNSIKIIPRVLKKGRNKTNYSNFFFKKKN